MSLKISTRQAEYQPVPEGSYIAICYGVADIGEQYNEKFKKLSHKIIITWEICDDDLREDFGRGKMERRAISKEYTASFNEKSNLYKDIRPWIGSEFSGDTFNLAELVGKGCTISVINEKGSDNKVYSNISSVGPLVKGMQVKGPENAIVVYDMDESPDDVFLQLPEWIQKRIRTSKSGFTADFVNVDVDSETGNVTTKETKSITADEAASKDTNPNSKISASESVEVSEADDVFD